MAAYYLPQNAGAIARKYIQDPQLLSFIDAEVDATSYSILSEGLPIFHRKSRKQTAAHYFHNKCFFFFFFANSPTHSLIIQIIDL